MKVAISIDTGTYVKFFLVCAAFVVAGYLLIKLQAAFTLLFVAFFLAIALNPPVSKLARLLPGQSRIGATTISYLLVISLLGGLLVLAIPPAVEQSVRFFQQVPSYLEQLQRAQQGPVEDFLRQYGLTDQFNQAIDDAKSRSSAIASQVGGSFVDTVGNFFSALVSIVTVLVLTFLMLIEGPAWMRRIWSVYTDEVRRDRDRALVHEMYRTVTSYVNGQVIVAAIASGLTLLVLLLLGTFLNVPIGVAFPLAGAVFLASMIPMIGATIGGAIVTIVLLFNDPTAALIFLIYFIIYQQIENNFIQPVVQSRSVGLTALSVLSAVLIGIALGGILGGLVAIPVAACIKVLITHYLQHRREKAQLKPKTLASKLRATIDRATKTTKDKTA